MNRKQLAQSEQGLSRLPGLRSATRAAVTSLCCALLVAVGTFSVAFATPIAQPVVSINPGVAPAGASVTVTGTNFTQGSTILIGYTSGDCTANVTSISGASGMVDGTGTVVITFTWPTTTTGNYYVCATDSNTHSSVKSQTSIQIMPTPTLSVSSPVYSGQPVTVTGAHFLPTATAGGGSVDVAYGNGSDGCANPAGSATVDANGNFSVTFTAPHADTDQPITITAVEPQGTCGKTNPGPNFQAQATATVSPAPSITVSSPMTAGQSATVSGKHFLPAGSTVEIRYGNSGSDGCTTALGTTTAGSDGSFSFTFKVPDVSADKQVTIAASAPQGACSQPKIKATAAATFKAIKSSPPPPFLEYCLIGLLLLLLLLLLLFLVFRRRKEDEPVTIEERDRVFVPTSGGGAATPGGVALIDRQIVARDRRGREVVIAEEVTTVEEEEEDLP